VHIDAKTFDVEMKRIARSPNDVGVGGVKIPNERTQTDEGIKNSQSSPI
jgi:hypothetical protein